MKDNGIKPAINGKKKMLTESQIEKISKIIEAQELGNRFAQANSIKKKLPNESIIYFGDTEHLPYGEKSQESIKLYSKKIIDFLVYKKCKIIICACNSASSAINTFVYNKSNNIKVYNVIDPIISEVANKYANNNIGVIGTKATIGSNVYADKLKSYDKKIKVSSLATPLLAPMIEENFIKGLAELILQKETRTNFVSSLMCPNKFIKCPCLEI